MDSAWVFTYAPDRPSSVRSMFISDEPDQIELTLEDNVWDLLDDVPAEALGDDALSGTWAYYDASLYTFDEASEDFAAYIAWKAACA